MYVYIIYSIYEFNTFQCVSFLLCSVNSILLRNKNRWDLTMNCRAQMEQGYLNYKKTRPPRTLP